MRLVLPALLAAAATLSGCAPLAGAAVGAAIATDDPHSTGESAEFIVPVAIGGLALIAVAALIARSNHREAAASVPEPSVTSDDARLERMFMQGRVLAAEGNCAAVHGLGRAVERVAPEMAIAFTSDPGIAHCY